MKRALVTGASTGIGQATVRWLRERGWQVVATARRADRLEVLAAETGCESIPADLTSVDDVERLVSEASAGGRITALVNVAGGAIGTETIEGSIDENWQRMFDINVMSSLRLTRAFLPSMRAEGGDIVFLTSTSAQETYAGGGGYVAAKHAERVIATTLRREVLGDPVRVIDIEPGMVKTEEFSLNRLGSKEAADAVYAGVAEPLTAEDVAEAIVWSLDLPRHVNIDTMIIRPVAQAGAGLVARTPGA